MSLADDLRRCSKEEASSLANLLSDYNEEYGCRETEWSWIGVHDWRIERRLIMREAMKDEQVQAAALNELARLCHEANKKWWLDLERGCRHCDGYGKLATVANSPLGDVWTLGSTTIKLAPVEEVRYIICSVCKGVPYPPKNRNVGELLMLCVSELAEALEGNRKGLMDDKLPRRKMFEVELADCLIRIFDLCGGMGLDVGAAFVEKMAYNAQRADHKIENRLMEGGKAY